VTEGGRTYDAELPGVPVMGISADGDYRVVATDEQHAMLHRLVDEDRDRLDRLSAVLERAVALAERMAANT
jgi:hypothetical protein